MSRHDIRKFFDLWSCYNVDKKKKSNNVNIPNHNDYTSILFKCISCSLLIRYILLLLNGQTSFCLINDY